MLAFALGICALRKLLFRPNDDLAPRCSVADFLRNSGTFRTTRKRRMQSASAVLRMTDSATEDILAIAAPHEQLR
jgi:hypothetical protein